MNKLPCKDPEETLDTLFQGRLKVFQRDEGYRFSIDALLLAHFASPAPADRVLDLGTGCGIIPLILATRKGAGKIVGVEIQPALAGLARRNAALNRLSTRIQIWQKDLKSLDGRAGEFDLVLSNPPYRKVGSGRMNPGMEKAVARHEIKGSLEDVLKVSCRLLRAKGRVDVVYPASRAADLIQQMRRNGLEPKRIQFVHSHAGDVARLVLAEALKGGRAQLEVLPPFFIFDGSGKYTPEAQKLFT